MATFLFWNVNRQPITDFIVKLVRDHSVDILVIAESSIGDSELLAQLNDGQTRIYFTDMILPRRVRIYHRYPPKFVRPISDRGYLAFRHFELPLCKPLLLGAVHLPSKSYESEGEQLFDCTDFAREIEKVETLVGHSRTVVVGDFNMNPFEQGVIAASGFHAIMDRRIAMRGSRNVHGKEYQFFYNPMWNYFGDRRGSAAGTYYYDKGTQVNYYWHIFDQVLIRPELLQAFQNDELEIVTAVGSVSLLDNAGRPRSSVGSDHLPILFKINFEKEG